MHYLIHRLEKQLLGKETYLALLCCAALSPVQLFETPMDCSPPGFFVPGIPQARILKWVAIHFSRRSSQPRDRTCISCIGRLILYCWATRETYLNINYKWIKVHCENANHKSWTFTKHTLNGEDFPSVREIEGRRKWLIDLIMQLKLWNIKNVTLDNKSF